jgi:non-specific serine/threonine protein kinase
MDKGATPFGELLKRHRVASGISQESLAERARLSADAISTLERGTRRAPYRETVSQLSSALGLSAAQQTELEAAADRARGRQPRVEDAPRPEQNLPTRLTSFVGRSEEIAELTGLLAEHRLVTVTGSGGVGKTRIAVEAAGHLLGDRFPEARFVDFSPLEDGTFVASAIATAFEVPLPEAPEPLPWLASRLKTRSLLLILDNCEHVINDAAAAAGIILRACPGITILATSRERLAIDGEHVYRLPSLPVPGGVPATIEEACTYDAFRLFMDRAKSSDQRFPLTATSLKAVAEICQRLEGIPLALELAATRLPVLGLDTLNERLKSHFLTMTGARDLPQRQQTMLATIEWSYELLSPQEQSLLRRLAVFRGGSTLEAAAAVCGDEAVSADAVPDVAALLVDKSLLFPTIGERPRFVMLESVREFAATKLREGREFDAAARAHAQWLATVADRAHDVLLEIPRAQWFREFGPEIDNVRSALDWCFNGSVETDVVIGARILGGLRTLWLHRFSHAECLAWSTSVLGRLDIARHPIVAARVMRAEVQASFGPAKLTAGKRAVPTFEQIGDHQGLTMLFATLANESSRLEVFDEADEFIAKAFALADREELQQTFTYVLILQLRCEVHLRSGRLTEARADLAHAGRLRRTMPEADDAYVPLNREANIELADENFQRSAELFEASIAQPFSRTPDSQNGLCVAYLKLGNIDAAERAAREAIKMSHSNLRHFTDSLLSWAAVVAGRGRPQLAARLFGFVEVHSDVGQHGGVVARTCHDILMTSLQQQLSPEALAELVAEGAQLDHGRAAEEALSL